MAFAEILERLLLPVSAGDASQDDRSNEVGYVFTIVSPPSLAKFMPPLDMCLSTSGLFSYADCQCGLLISRFCMSKHAAVEVVAVATKSNYLRQPNCIVVMVCSGLVSKTCDSDEVKCLSIVLAYCLLITFQFADPTRRLTKPSLVKLSEFLLPPPPPSLPFPSLPFPNHVSLPLTSLCRGSGDVEVMPSWQC